MKHYIRYLSFILANVGKYLIYRKYRAYTMMLDVTYVNNLKLSEKARDIKGCVVECGVWRGGQIAGIVEILGKSRKYLLFDSFEGLPPAQEIDGKKAIEWQNNTESNTYFDNCKAEMNWAQEAMQKTGCADFQLIKGWFQDTIPSYKFDEPIALLRLDADWYDSTMTCLEYLFPNVAPGGLIIVDDYFAWDGCSKAVHDYLSQHSLSERICQFNDNVCYIIKKS